MAFGFPAYHEERVRYPDVTAGELMNAADAVFHRLKWCGDQTGKWRFRVNTGLSLWSWGETFIVTVEDDEELLVRSECAMPTQCIDWGRNRANVKKFLQRMDEVLEARARRRARDPDEDEPY